MNKWDSWSFQYFFQNGDFSTVCVVSQINSISFRLHLTRKSMHKRNNDGEYDKELKTTDKVANEFKRLCCMNGEAAACFGAHERWR